MFVHGLHLLLRGGPVMWPLFVCALLSLTLILERTLYLLRLPLWQDAPDLGSAEPTRREWLLRQARLLRQGLPALDTIITLAPLLGLLGTVTGMIQAFGLLGTADDQGPTVITGGVSEALIATATGLVIAVVSLIGYNALTERVRALLGQMAGAAATPHQKRTTAMTRPPLKRARIEIIPMIDTIFFLLVFFIVESLSMVQLSARQVTLPISITAAEKPGANVVVTLTRDGAYYLDRQPVTEAEILPQVAARVAGNPNLVVVLNCDKSQPMTKFARIFDLVKQANPVQVMIATAPTAGEALGGERGGDAPSGNRTSQSPH